MSLFRRFIFFIAAFLCFTPLVSAPVALLLGILSAQWPGNPFGAYNKKLTTILLQVAIVALGFGLNFTSALKAGSNGFVFTIISIASTIVGGLMLGFLFKSGFKTSFLVSSGTAICGGSAIAAVAPVVNADENQISISLGIVFILNAIALFVFPPIGKAFEMTGDQFGMWAAIAIHDTSSVVGAASKFGNNSLEVATTVKLARALWIIPLVLVTALIFRSKGKIKFPYFILGFVVAMMAGTYITSIKEFSGIIYSSGRSILNVCLFLIGSGLSYSRLKSIGYRPLLQGIVLWLLISSITFVVIMYA